MPPKLAILALGPRGCEICHSPSELSAADSDGHHHDPSLQPFTWDVSSLPCLPLLGPLNHSSSIKAAKCPPNAMKGQSRTFISCNDCVRARWCERCYKFWCRNCYQVERTKYTHLQTVELEQNPKLAAVVQNESKESIKVFMGLCVENCLVGELMSGTGEGGMWG